MAKSKRTSMTVNYTTVRRLKKLVNEIEVPISKNRESVTNYLLYQISKGDFDDVKPMKTRDKEKMLVDKATKDKADVRARELGFKNIGEMLERVVHEEFKRLSKSKGSKYKVHFEKIEDEDEDEDEESDEGVEEDGKD